jgi:monoamine oxidase
MDDFLRRVAANKLKQAPNWSFDEWLTIAVVGGGIAGLVAAAHIAASGLQPVVFEATSRVGGRARTRIVGGFHFNQGPHALYTGGALNAALREFGVSISGGNPDLSAGWALWEQGVSPLPVMRLGQNADALDEINKTALKSLFERIVAANDFGREWRCGVRSAICPY